MNTFSLMRNCTGLCCRTSFGVVGWFGILPGLVFVLLLSAVELSAQNLRLERHIIGAMATGSTSSGLHLSTTMGETAISTMGQGSLRINQGFHQVDGCVFFGEIIATSVRLDCNTPEIVLRHGFGEVVWEWIDSTGTSLGSEDSIVLNTPGIYSIELEKDLCTDKVSIEIIQDTMLPSLPDVISDTIDCITGEAIIQTIGIVGDSLWQWYDSAQQPLQGDTVLLVDTPGEYTLVVTGQNGCRDSISVEVYESTDAPQLTLETDGALNCILDTITLQATSSTPGVLIIWLNPAGDSLEQAEVTTDTAGRWEVFVKNPENGCITREVYEIIIDRALPAYSLEGDTLNCRQTAIDLRVNYSDTASALYTWSSPTDVMIEGNLPAYSISEPGLWKLTLTNLENGCAKTDSIYIIGDFEQPEVSAGHDPIACLDESVRLWGESSDMAEAMDWFGPSGHLVGNGSEVIVGAGGTYRLQVTARNGCTADKVVEVSLWKWDLLPTVFTPNGDGRNDLLVLSPCEDTNILPNMDLIVFNRWGQEVFQRKGYQHDWDGTHNGRLVPTGQYYYVLRLNDKEFKKPLTIIY